MVRCKTDTAMEQNYGTSLTTNDMMDTERPMKTSMIHLRDVHIPELMKRQ